jgi:hypothetical protein
MVVYLENYKGIINLMFDDDLFIATRELLLTGRGNGIRLDSTPPVFSSYYSGKLVTVTGNSQVITLKLHCHPQKMGNVYGNI